MPLGFERINAKRRQPNERIVFLKPLDGPDKEIALDFLERIAAIMNPVDYEGKSSVCHVAIFRLEEFPPNTEFWGRNFNAGEVIQLVLKHPRTGMWLSFEFVQGVMIHELAHIKQMNHSGAFWAVRNKFARELGVLHREGYTGEGFWSAGRTLISNQPFMHNRPLAEDELPEHLCGGTYRSRRRQLSGTDTAAPKRKISYAEQQERKREKKFIKPYGEGTTLGGDEVERIKLESDVRAKKPLPKAPKIASSKRSRDLRAAAALKRFDGQIRKEEEKMDVDKLGEGDGEYEDNNWSYDEDDEKAAVDVGGGNRLVPVSAKEDDVKIKGEEDRELQELVSCGTAGGWLSGAINGAVGSSFSGNETKSTPRRRESTAQLEVVDLTRDSPRKLSQNPRDQLSSKVSSPPSPSSIKTFLNCSACSVDNSPDAVRCTVCANLFEPKLHPGSWKCTVAGQYWNSGDVGICGVCGEKKQVDK